MSITATRLNWETEYERKKVKAEDAAALIKDNDVVATNGGSCIPDAFCRALAARAKSLNNVTLVQGLGLEFYEYMKPEYKENIRIETVFVGPVERICIQWGTTQYVPVHLQQLENFLLARKPNVVAAVVTPPDEEGYMNRSNFGGLCPRVAFDMAETVIVEVNPNTPWLVGEDFKIHVSKVDVIIENDRPVNEIPDIPITENEQKIAAFIADMVPNGATVQLGFGGLANAVGYFLKDKRDLGLHCEVISTSVMELIKSGAVNNSKKTLWPGKSVGCFCVGTRELYDFVDHNEDFIFFEINYVNDPDIIKLNHNLVSINNALMVNLSGEVASESIGTMQYSGTGGQVNFVHGAYKAPGGKSIIALNSSYVDKEGNLRSRILPVLPPGTVVTTSRNDVEYIATEYGVVNLRYKSVGERAKSLISIAHPDLRDELRFEAKKYGWL